MTVKDIAEALQSSALAPLFLNIESPDIEERDDPKATIVQLKLKSPLPSDGDKASKLIIIETDDHISVRIPAITQSKEAELIARVGHVNYMVKVGRMYWDPEDGEIGVDWVVKKSSAADLSAEAMEYTIACLIHIYSNETLYFLAKTLKGKVPEALLKPILESAQNEIKETFVPAMESVMGG